MADRSTRALSFGANAAEYERARPDYPLDAARWLAGEAAGTIVEPGAGTGKLTRSLAQLGARVVAVEPDERMLAVLRGHGLPGVEARGGSAEALPVADGAADAVVAGSSFHWFDLERALPEFARVLRRGGVLGFAWNRRDDAAPAMAQLSELIRGEDRGRPRWHDRDWQGAVEASGLFERPERAEFHHVLALPEDGLADLLRSYSRVAALSRADQDAVVATAQAAIDRAPELVRGGRLELPFVVECYRARVV
jgi:SAM-dependent methyltransferase